MKFSLLVLTFILMACASKPEAPACSDATQTVFLPRKEADKILGNVGPFLTDAQITQEHGEEGASSVWRFSNMPSDSVYFLMGLREGDAIWKTNLGEQKSSINLISDLAGIPSGTTNCLFVRDQDNNERVIKILVEKK